jgi:hypothetical protein
LAEDSEKGANAFADAAKLRRRSARNCERSIETMLQVRLSQTSRSTIICELE